MRQIPMPPGQIKGGRTSVRRPRSLRPCCMHLEDRRLLSVGLKGSRPNAPIGTPIVWTAKADDHGGRPVYQFRVGTVGGTLYTVRDFSPKASFAYAPMQEGTYVMQVTVKDDFGSTSSETTSVVFNARSRVVGGNAAISRTSNPLVALYSAPPSTGSSMAVAFRPLGAGATWQTTSPMPVVPGQSTNVLVAGLRPDTTYVMRHVLSDGTTSAPKRFRTGSLPTNLAFPSFAVRTRPTPGTNLAQGVVLHIGANSPNGTVNTSATDPAGNLVWYFDPVANHFPGYAPSLVPGGTLLMLGGKQDNIGGANTLREIDLAGNTLRETNINAVNVELAALGRHSIENFNHDAQRLPNGDTVTLAATARTVDLHGTPTRYIGDMVVVLDKNFQVKWAWDPFDWLDTNRLPTGGEGPLDWTHANSVAWSPADGNLIVSMRSQDWVIKIDYDQGAGDGHIVWRLGQGGDFTINSNDASPWFSHQHNAHYVDDSTLLVFDNGNTRRATDPGAHSRGQELILDETTMQATLVLNADLGNYAPAVGSAQRLPDGNFVFDSGFKKQTIGVRADGARVYLLKTFIPGVQYRSYIYSTLYGNPGDVIVPRV